MLRVETKKFEGQNYNSTRFVLRLKVNIDLCALLAEVKSKRELPEEADVFLAESY